MYFYKVVFIVDNIDNIKTHFSKIEGNFWLVGFKKFIQIKSCEATCHPHERL